MSGVIDTHIHLDLMTEQATCLEEGRQRGVSCWVVPGVNPENWSKLMAVVEAHGDVFAAPGIHPQFAGSCGDRHYRELRKLLQHPKAVALGEVGLDRHLAVPWRDQVALLVKQLRVARDTGKPLLIHARRSTEDILAMLQQEGADELGGIFHAFSGSEETARRVFDAGYLLGIGGAVTWPNARRLPSVVRMVPAEALVLETDAPFMTPEPHRGELNRPVYLSLIAEKVAELRGWSIAETARATSANVRRVLPLP